ncbi:MAG: hypothetical protein J6A17_05125 [Bacilli bacterium]|nr:hypothetical protein [Bacilli bacterium]
MKINKYTLVHEDGKMSLAIRLGIYYDEDYSNYDPYSDYRKLRLFTLCYRPRYNDFIQISCVKPLPKRLIDRYKDAYICEQTIKELNAIGIHDFNEIRDVINSYHNYQDLLVYEEYRNKAGKNDNKVYQKLLEVKNVIEDKNR